MKPTRTLFQPFLLLTLLMVAGGIFNRAHAQYQSFFGNNITEYFIQGEGVSYVTDYDPAWLLGNTHNYLLSKNDTAIINNHLYYRGGSFTNAFLREDTITGRIYRYDPILDEDIIICDMSLSVGDTFWMPFDRSRSYNGVEYGKPVPIIADSVLFINGLKHIIFRKPYPCPVLYDEEIHHHSILFIEGVGPNFSPFGWLNGLWENCSGSWFETDSSLICGYGHWNPFLLCVHKDDELVFMSDERAGCWQNNNVSIKEDKKDVFVLYPTPTRNILNIVFENLPIQKGTLYITDMVGRVVYSQETAEQHLKINVKRFQSGLYVVTWIAGGKKHSVKFVKK